MKHDHATIVKYGTKYESEHMDFYRLYDQWAGVWHEDVPEDKRQELLHGTERDEPVMAKKRRSDGTYRFVKNRLVWMMVRKLLRAMGIR